MHSLAHLVLMGWAVCAGTGLGSVLPMASMRMTANVRAVVQALAQAADGQALYARQLTVLTGLRNGTLHPILERLRSHGWVEDKWEDRDRRELGRPLRRYYRLTELGRSGAVEVRCAAKVQLREAEVVAVEVRVLTSLGDVEGFEQGLAAFLGSCPHVAGGYTFSCWPLGN